jgi:ubiquinone/menaquinone biosynthesis C-methylase UbiE
MGEALQNRRSYAETPLQEIDLKETGTFSRILDVGAGGEGLAARIWNDNVYGVDLRTQEIKEIVQRGIVCNWIIGDARRLCFQNDVFDCATIWFSLMYVPELDDKIQVLSECKRVLTEHGFLSIKDSVIDCEKDVFVLHAKFALPNRDILQTSYGVSGAQKQKPEWVEQVLMGLDFQITEKKSRKHWFEIKCKKKGSDFR